MKLKDNLTELKFWATLLLSAAAFASCDSVMDWDEGLDCSTDYLVRFRYDLNMKYADAFSHEVKSVALYAFDPATGKLAYQVTDSGDKLAQEGYAMTVDFDPERYDLLAWGGLMNGESFTVPALTVGSSTMEDVTCALNVKQDADGNYADTDLLPLFYGTLAATDTRTAYYEKSVTIPLTKDTNIFRVTLQYVTDPMDEISADDFDFRITDGNGLLASDNLPVAGNDVNYREWTAKDLSANIGNEGSDVALPGVMAELTTNRLMDLSEARLEIYNKKLDEKIISLPLTEYLLMTKGDKYEQMPNQEYLDRQDEWNLTFFLDAGYRWEKTYILINSWRIVLNNADL